MESSYRRGMPLHPIQAPSPLTRSPSPTKTGRPLSIFGSTSSTNLTKDSNGTATGHDLQRRPTHRSAASLSSINLAALSLSSSTSLASINNVLNSTTTASHGTVGGMVHSPTISSFSPVLTSHAGSPATGWGGFNERARAVGAVHEDSQNKVFCKWLNARLDPRDEPFTDLGSDFSDGTRLIRLVETLTEQSLGRFNHVPHHRVQKFENAKQALERIKEMGVHLTNIGPEDIVDGNRKLILGMIWSLVLRFSIADIQEEGSHAKEGLLLWCQRKTQPYPEVEVENFTRSFQDGLAFCALIHRHRPDLLDWDALDKDTNNAEANLKLAFRIAEERLGIPQLLDVEDVCGRRPDERSVMTYVAQYFHAFSTTAQAETEARVISNFVDIMSSLMVGLHDYERRVEEFLTWATSTLSDWHANPPMPPFDMLMATRTEMDAYRRTDKKRWNKERSDLAELLLNIQTKLKTYSLRSYEPETRYSTASIEDCWAELLEAEMLRSRQINAALRQLQEDARRRLAEVANALHQKLIDAGWDLANVRGSLDSQSEAVHRISLVLGPLQPELDVVRRAEHTCALYRAELNDYTIHTSDELETELHTLQERVRDRTLFIDKQAAARKATTVPSKVLEEIDSAFKSFDKENSGRLDLDQLAGALGALGVAEINLDEIHAQVGEEVTYDEFIQFMIGRHEVRPTGERLWSCFRSAAGSKPYITELDLQRLRLPAAAASFLLDKMDAYEPRPVDLAAGSDNDDEPIEAGALDYEAFLAKFLE